MSDELPEARVATDAVYIDGTKAQYYRQLPDDHCYGGDE